MTIQNSKLPTLRLNALGLAVCLSLALAPNSWAASILGSMDTYAIMGGATSVGTAATNTVGYSTFIYGGDLGAPGGTTGGAGDHIFEGAGQTLATTAENQTDFDRAFDGLSNIAADGTPTTIGGIRTYTPGTYDLGTTAATAAGKTFTLDAQGQTGAAWIFRAGTTFTMGANSSVEFINEADGATADNYGLFWLAGTTIDLGANSNFAGNLLSPTIDFGNGASLRGSAMANIMNLDQNDIQATDGGYTSGLRFSDSGSTLTTLVATPIPEPTSSVLVISGLMMLVVLRRRVK